MFIGKKVRVKDNLIVDKFYGGLRFHNGMSLFKGKTFTVRGVPWYDSEGFYLENTDGYVFSKEMFEIC